MARFGSGTRSPGRPVSPPLVHAHRVNDLAFSPDGTYLATASGDPLARVWKLEIDDRSLDDWSKLAHRCPTPPPTMCSSSARRQHQGNAAPPAERTSGAAIRSYDSLQQ